MHWIDPSSLPRVAGRVSGFTLNPRGEVDGLLLDGARQVHVPPHMGAAVEKMFSIGDEVEAHYVKPRGAEVFAAVSVGKPGGKALVDAGPPPKHERAHRDKPASKVVELEGCVQTTLHAPKGEVCGAVLESGEQLRVDPKANAELACYFVPGAAVRVWGSAFTRKKTVVVEVGEIGFAKDFE